MNFSNAIREVVERTKRGDRVPLIRQAINKAVVDFSRMKKFRKDLRTLKWAVPPEYTDKTVLSLAWEEFIGEVREFEEIRAVNAACTLKEILSNETLQNGRVRKGVYYQSGEGVFLSLVHPTPHIIFTYFSYPLRLVEDTDTNWVLRSVFDEVVERASALVFKGIGEDREADRAMQVSMLSYERAMRDLV